MLILSQFKESLVNLRDHMMRTLVHIAAYQNAIACFKLLIIKGASVNLKDAHNRTPLMMACYMGHQLIVESLLEKSCDVDVADTNGDTALHIACRKGHEVIASLILKATTSKSDCISHQNKKGQTPLHLAAPLGMIDVVETLLTKGASITAVDSKGLSPPLACASNEDVAMCLAMILSVFLATPANSEARRSICSLSSLRLSDSSFSTRLSEVGVGDVTFTVPSDDANSSPDRSQSNSQAVDDPSIVPNAFSAAAAATPAVAVPPAATSAGGGGLPTTPASKKVGAKSQSDVNHNTSNGCTDKETSEFI